MERVCIIIDSGNFYHLVLKKLGVQSVDFDFDKFAYFLAGEREIIKEGKRFYVATVRDRGDEYESKQAMSNQTALFSRLISAGDWVIKRKMGSTLFLTIFEPKIEPQRKINSVRGRLDERSVSFLSSRGE